MPGILVVDDERAIVRALRINLSARGYEVHVAVDGRTALELATRVRPDVVVLDLGLPDVDGLDVIHGVRGWSQVPIIVLSARDQEAQKIEALDAGADDYVTKPFGMGEFLARLRAALRRIRPESGDPKVVTSDFVIDLENRAVRRNDGTIVRLTPTEWRIAEILARHPGRLITAQHLLREVWGPNYRDETHYLRVYMAQLRRKLEPDPKRPRYFITEPAIGYRFVIDS